MSNLYTELLRIQDLGLTANEIPKHITISMQT